MRKMEEADIFIRDYYNGKLDAGQTQVFQEKYASDPAFKELADQIEKEALGIRSHSRDELKAKFQSWEKTPEVLGTANNIRTFPYLKMGIAASFILAILYLGKSFLPIEQEDLFLAYYEPYENFEYTPTRNETDETGTDKHKAYTAYDASNYQEAKQYFDRLIAADGSDTAALFFRGICQMENLSYDSALADFALVLENENSYYAEAALWYLSLIAIEQENPARARQYLDRLTYSEDYQTRVQALLEKLN